jgi:hypothetical protein
MTKVNMARFPFNSRHRENSSLLLSQIVEFEAGGVPDMVSKPSGITAAASAGSVKRSGGGAFFVPGRQNKRRARVRRKTWSVPSRGSYSAVTFRFQSLNQGTRAR